MIGTGEACLVYQSGQEIGLVQEGLVWCTKVIGHDRPCLGADYYAQIP